MSCETIEPGGQVEKDPSAKKIYQFDWTDYLACLGELIAGSTFTITGPDSILTKDNESIVSGSKITQLRVLAGTPGYVYTITNHITTNGTPAQEDERSFTVLVEDR